MSRLMMGALIAVTVLIGMTVRLTAFRRADSYAVEMGKASLIIYIIKIIMECKSSQMFMERYFSHLVVLIVLEYTICIIHRLFCDLCFETIQNRINTAKEQMYDMSDGDLSIAEGKFLDDIGIIAKRSLYLSYSRFIDRWLRDFPLTRIFFKNQDADAGCKPGKTELRRSLAEISNYIIEIAIGHKMNRNDLFREGDFNIPESAQMIGLLCFQILPILTIVVALEFI